MIYIYRDYSCSLSKHNCAEILQGLAIAGGSITSTFVLNNAFPTKSVGRWTMFFRLQFTAQEQVNTFHALGFKTEAPEVVVCS